MDTTCPKIAKCPLFNGTLLKRSESEDTYKNRYCRSKFAECKRFQISELVGKCPDFVMPNSMLTIDQIVERMKKEGQL